jgi:hypothetical protein
MRLSWKVRRLGQQSIGVAVVFIHLELLSARSCALLLVWWVATVVDRHHFTEEEVLMSPGAAMPMRCDAVGCRAQATGVGVGVGVRRRSWEFLSKVR